MSTQQKAKRLVVKVGRAQLSTRNGWLSPKTFASLAAQITGLRRRGIVTTVVSSGAIVAGRQALAARGVPYEELDEKTLASSGARLLLHHWDRAFGPHGLATGQVLASFYNCCHQDERSSIRATLLQQMEHSIVPIVNENDPVSPDEIALMELGFSENDVLAAFIADIIDANAVIFFSDAGGVYEGDPRIGEKGRRYQTIDAWNVPRSLLPKKSRRANLPSFGRGGIDSKISAAAMCHRAGMMVSIADLNGSSDILERFVRGEAVGTMMGEVTNFVPG